MIFATVSIPMILWSAFIIFMTAYVECIKYFSRTLKEENPSLWEELCQRQSGVGRINHGRIFRRFLFRGEFRSLNNPKTSRAGFWTGITGILAGLSTGVLYWYYVLYLPYKK
jgi:hypothetical protein